MTVVTREDVQALRGDVHMDERTTKEAVVSEQLYGERIAKLEGSAEHWATKADVKDVLVEVANVRTEVASTRSDVRAVQDEFTSFRADVREEFAGFDERLRSLEQAVSNNITGLLKPLGWLGGWVGRVLALVSLAVLTSLFNRVLALLNWF